MNRVDSGDLRPLRTKKSFFEKANRPRMISEIQLRSFGAVTGLIFEGGGYVEIVMSWPELDRIILAWLDHERARKRPKAKLVQALQYLSARVHWFRPVLFAEVPIAMHRAKITPILRDASEEREAKKKARRVTR